jgi:hypothetical protein
MLSNCHSTCRYVSEHDYVLHLAIAITCTRYDLYCCGMFVNMLICYIEQTQSCACAMTCTACVLNAKSVLLVFHCTGQAEADC